MTGAEFGGRGSEVDIDLLADYIGGALAGTPDESAVAGLIAGDTAWRQAHRELADGMAAVSAELARLTAGPMPADLAHRLDTLLSTTAPAELSEPAPIPIDRAIRRARGSWPGSARRLRWATPIAIAAGVAAFAGFGLDYLAGRDGTSGQSGTAGESTVAAGDVVRLNTGTDYTSTTLAELPRGHALIASPDPSPVTKDAPDRIAVDSADPLSRLRAQAALQACLDAIQQANGGGPITVQTVDYASFDARPAVVVRFSAPNGVWAWASGAQCGTASGADMLASAPVR